jgi:hypothetical protein
MKVERVHRLRPRRPVRRGFTLVELMVAGLCTAMLLGTLSLSLGQIGRAKISCKERLDAHLRADAALNAIRADLVSILRSDDLFDTRFLLIDGAIGTPLGELDRDEMIVFNTRLRPIRNTDFNGEGSEYETHYRISDDGGAPTLWQRRDPFPDEYPLAGGMANSLVENILALRVEAFDGEQWYDDWDSDYEGLPVGVRITVEASGARPEQSPYEAVTATLRTVVAIDRIMPPFDQVQLSEEELEELDARVLIDPAKAQGAGEAGAGQGGEAGGEADSGAGSPGGGGVNTMGGGGRGGGRGGSGGGGRGGGGGGGGGTLNPGNSPGLTRPPRTGTLSPGGGSTRPR